MGKATSEDQDRLHDAARRVFEPRADRRLGDEDLREIGENLVGFFGILGEWSRSERQPAPPSPKTAQQKDETLKQDGPERGKGGVRATRTRRKEGDKGEPILRSVPGPVEATVGVSHAQQKGAPSQ